MAFTELYTKQLHPFSEHFILRYLLEISVHSRSFAVNN
jgi:hypothetical protein